MIFVCGVTARVAIRPSDLPKFRHGGEIPLALNPAARLYPVDEERTRFVSRSRVRAQSVRTRLLTYAIEPAGFLMPRRMLLGLKQRAEALQAARTSDPRTNRPAAA